MRLDREREREREGAELITDKLKERHEPGVVHMHTHTHTHTRSKGSHPWTKLVVLSRRIVLSYIRLSLFLRVRIRDEG